MRKRICSLLLAACLVLLIPVSLLVSGMLLPDFYGDSYYAQLSRMYDRLYETEGKKLVLIGGSNLAFGVDTGLLEETLVERGFDYTVCPFGLYAAVGTSAMLELSKDALGPGDIVVLAIEPTSDTMSNYFGATAFWKCCENAPQMLLSLNSSQRAAVIGNYLDYLQERWAIQREGTVPVAEGVYANAAFDETCNLVYDRPGNTMPLGYDTGSPIDLEQVTIEEAFAQQVNAFCVRAAEAGATVYLSFSPVNRSALVEQRAVEDFFSLCNETFLCPIISDPNAYILDSGWFYDSNFHLNTAGAKIRTMLLAEDILTQLGNYGPLTWEMPEMPPSLAQWEDVEADTDLFRYTPLGEGWLISGLTEAGLAQASLTVPASREGKPVVGFTEDALANAPQLQELTLPATIETLPRDFLAGCPAIQTLILEHTYRVCTITEETFQTLKQLKILVPRESYSLYRDGDGCEANPWAEYLDWIYSY